MMEGIYGLKPQGAVSAIENVQSPLHYPKAGKMSLPSKDIYVSEDGIRACEEEPSKMRLTPDKANDLAKRYDVKNMTRNEYSNLLQELRDSRVISSKEFSVGFGGAVPYTVPDGVKMTMGPVEKTDFDVWPSGKERVDFTKLLRACARYCTDFTSEQEENSDGKKVGSSLSDSYNRLSEIFEQIDRAAESLKK